MTHRSAIAGNVGDARTLRTVTTGRDCSQCGKPVVVGHILVSGTIVNDAGQMVSDIEHRHYDCLPIALRDADPFVTAARETAESGIRDEALHAHLQTVMTDGS